MTKPADNMGRRRKLYDITGLESRMPGVDLDDLLAQAHEMRQLDGILHFDADERVVVGERIVSRHVESVAFSIFDLISKQNGPAHHDQTF